MELSIDSHKAIILCGGKGTRIRGVDDRLPKPMIPVGRHPIVVHILEHYARHGIREFVLCLGYLGDVIASYFGAPHEQSAATVSHVLPSGVRVNVTLAATGLESMTGTRLLRVKELTEGRDFMLTYGDGLSNVDIHELLKFHQSRDVAMTLTAVRPPSRFGEVELDSKGIATSFNEKPQTSAGLISGGFFVCRPEMFNYLNEGENVILEAAPMRFMAQRKRLGGYVHDGFWQCMDTFRDWEMLNELESSGRSPWRT